jgi:hypothetical protein
LSRVTSLADGLFVLSDFEEVRNRSWRPVGSSGLEPFNKYVFLNGERALLLDTGPRAHRDSMLASLVPLVGSRSLTVMISRSEPDAITNVGAVVDQFPDLRVVGIMKNLPLLGLVEMARTPRDGLVAERMVMDRPLTDYGFPDLTPVEPVIKTLSTIWISDAGREALFTSDFFSAELLADQSESVVRTGPDGAPSRAAIRAALLAKFDWLEKAGLTRHREAWDRFFTAQRPVLLAPGLGRLQSGAAHVAGVIADYRAAIFGD